MQIDDGQIRRVTFDRPAQKNAMTGAVARELADAVGTVEADTHDAVLITGRGDAFSAGGDIEAMAAREETAAEAHARVRETLGAVAEAVLTAPVPVVARVDGDAVGAGLSLVAVCDFAYAAETARFGASFVNVGLVPDMGGTTILPRLVGLRRLKELAFTGELVDADAAAEMDLLNAAVPAAELDDRVDDLLGTLGEQPTANIGLAKQAIHDNLGRGWREGLAHEAHVQSLAYDTPAHERGVEAFLAGDSPEFDDL